jgi:multidrug efflux system outer membrane protein
LQRYNGGVENYLAVLDAQRVQLSTQSQLAQAQTRLATSLVAVYKSLGGGWENEVKQVADEGKSKSAKNN